MARTVLTPTNQSSVPAEAIPMGGRASKLGLHPDVIQEMKVSSNTNMENVSKECRDPQKAIDISLSPVLPIHKLPRTISVYLMAICTGSCGGILGTTLVSMSELLQIESTTYMSFALAGVSFGYFVGALISDLIYKRMPLSVEFLLFLSTFFMCISIGAAAWMPSIYLFIGIMLCMGFMRGFGNQVSREYLLYLWSGHPSRISLYNGLGFTSALCAAAIAGVSYVFLDPLPIQHPSGNQTLGHIHNIGIGPHSHNILERFPEETTPSLGNITDSYSTLMQLNYSSTSPPFSMNSSTISHLESTTIHIRTSENIDDDYTPNSIVEQIIYLISNHLFKLLNFTEDVSHQLTSKAVRIRWVYMILTAIVLMSAVYMLTVYIGAGKNRTIPKNTKCAPFFTLTKQTPVLIGNQKRYKCTLLCLFFLFRLFFTWCLITPSAWLPTYTVRELGWPQTRAALLMVVFYASIAVGRLFNIFLMKCQVPRFVLLASMLLILVGYCVLPFLGLHAVSVWVSTVTVAAGLSIILPTSITWMSQLLPVGFAVRQISYAGSGIGAIVALLTTGVMIDEFGTSAMVYVLVAGSVMLLMLLILMLIWARYGYSKDLSKSAQIDMLNVHTTRVNI